MTRVLFWWPMGVRKEQEAPTLTVIRKVSGFRCMAWAMPTAMGAIITAVATLFMMSDRVMVRISSIASMYTASRLPARDKPQFVMMSEAPVVCRALPRGIMEANKMMIDQSMPS